MRIDLFAAEPTFKAMDDRGLSKPYKTIVRDLRSRPSNMSKGLQR